jgi:hypothetical protein
MPHMPMRPGAARCGPMRPHAAHSARCGPVRPGAVPCGPMHRGFPSARTPAGGNSTSLFLFSGFGSGLLSAPSSATGFGFGGKRPFFWFVCSSFSACSRHQCGVRPSSSPLSPSPIVAAVATDETPVVVVATAVNTAVFPCPGPRAQKVFGCWVLGAGCCMLGLVTDSVTPWIGQAEGTNKKQQHNAEPVGCL